MENTSSRMASVEHQLQSFNTNLQASVEKALIHGMKSQESRMDQKFDKLMQALQATQAKRDRPHADDSDDAMESPLKPPPNKK